MLRRRGRLREESDDLHDALEPEPIEACAQLSLRLGKLGHVDERGVAMRPVPMRHASASVAAAPGQASTKAGACMRA